MTAKFTSQKFKIATLKKESEQLREQLGAVIAAMQQADIDCMFLPDRVRIVIHSHAKLIEHVCRITGADKKTATVESCFEALARVERWQDAAQEFRSDVEARHLAMLDEVTAAGLRIMKALDYQRDCIGAPWKGQEQAEEALEKSIKLSLKHMSEFDFREATP